MNFYMFRNVFVIVGVCAAIATPAMADAWSDVVKAAKKEGSLVLFKTNALPAINAAIKTFEQKYGIRVDLVEGRSSEIRERITTDQNSGRFSGDVQIGGYTTSSLLYKMGTYQSHGVLPNAGADRIKTPLKDNGTILPFVLSRFSMLINTSLVKPGDEPQSWADLLAPKWKDKILSTDPRAGGNAQVTYAALHDTFGRPTIEKLAAQNPVFVRDPGVAYRRIAQGEFPILLPANVGDLNTLDGLPVKGYLPKEGAPYVDNTAMVLKNAPHPNAARLLLNSLFEDDTQILLSTFGEQPATGLLSDRLSTTARELLQAPLMKQPDPFRQEELAKVFVEIFGR